MLSRNELVIGREGFLLTCFEASEKQTSSVGVDSPDETGEGEGWIALSETEEWDTSALFPAQFESSVFGGSLSFPGTKPGSAWLGPW